MFWQLFGTSGLLVLFALTFLGWVVSDRVKTNQLRQIENRLAQGWPRAGNDSRPNTRRDGQATQEHHKFANGIVDAHITIIGADGRVLAETARDDPSSMDNHGTRPEVIEAASSPDRLGVSIRESSTLQQKMIYVALKTDGVDGVSYVRLAMPLTTIQAEIASTAGLIWTTAGLTALLSLLLAFWLVRGFLRPLQELSRGADRIALGDYGHRIGADGPPEMRYLAQSFNNMSQRLAAQFSQLEEDRQQLRAVLSSMVEGVIAVDSEQRILFANDRAGQLLDFPAARVVGRALGDLLEQRADVQAVVRNALRDGTDHRRDLNGPFSKFEIRNSHANGSSLAVHVARLPGTPRAGPCSSFTTIRS